MFRQILEPSGTMGRAAKAGELLLEQQTAFCHARILTDMRPVFDEDAEQVGAFVLFHTLSIVFHEHGETRKIGLSMDADDLAELKDQIERAQRKEARLADLLKTYNLAVVETGARTDVEPARVVRL